MKSTYVGLDDGRNSRQHERSAQRDCLPDPARPQGAVEPSKLRPGRHVGVSLESLKEKLPQLECGGDCEEEVDYRVEACKQVYVILHYHCMWQRGNLTSLHKPYGGLH